jgi:tRNA (uracil-5-)-methyltransferase
MKNLERPPAYLPGYEAQLVDSGVHHSRRKLDEARNDLSTIVDYCKICTSPCKSEDETLGYRCSCTFQIVKDQNQHYYAMRHQKKPVLLGNLSFPIANKRIQRAMAGLLNALNDDVVGKPSALSRGLTSVSFSSSWSDTPACSCFVTLMYECPIDQSSWRKIATQVCGSLDLTRIIGRSKGSMIIATSRDDRDFLYDCLYLYKSENSLFSVTLSPADAIEPIQILYHKPVNAFFHPNSKAMINALEWILSRLQSIGKDLSMLEMYGGCGAHTIALSKSGLVKRITLVELDSRLVQACIHNCKLNGCLDGDLNDAQDGSAPVCVLEGDASKWAQKFRHRTDGDRVLKFDILLVDPPRMGLSKDVCQMANEGPFDHILYVSCGKSALKRDLQALHASYEVADCLLLDLFPRTDSVESLVHLKRRIL